MIDVDRVAAAIARYDATMSRDDGTPQEQERRCVEAAHECVADIRAALESADGGEAALQNPIAKLQERAQAGGLPLPVYTYSRIGGEDHMPMFHCDCEAEGVSAGGTGRNKQRAKRMAARGVLERLLAKGAA